MPPPPGCPSPSRSRPGGPNEARHHHRPGHPAGPHPRRRRPTALHPRSLTFAVRRSPFGAEAELRRRVSRCGLRPPCCAPPGRRIRPPVLVWGKHPTPPPLLRLSALFFDSSRAVVALSSPHVTTPRGSAVAAPL